MSNIVILYMRKSCETDSGPHVDSNSISAAGVPMSGTRVKHHMGTPTAQKQGITRAARVENRKNMYEEHLNS